MIPCDVMHLFLSIYLFDAYNDDDDGGGFISFIADVVNDDDDDDDDSWTVTGFTGLIVLALLCHQSPLPLSHPFPFFCLRVTSP